jgi:hypothetical protein
VVVIAIGAIVIDSAFVAACAGTDLSVTFTVNEYDPAAVAVPLIAPAVDSFNPPGSNPDATVHAYAVLPPVAANFAEYVLPTSPGTSVDVDTDNTPAAPAPVGIASAATVVAAAAANAANRRRTRRDRIRPEPE